MISRFLSSRKKQGSSDHLPVDEGTSVAIRPTAERAYQSNDGKEVRTTERHASVISTFQHLPSVRLAPPLTHARSRSQDRDSDPLGLRLLFAPGSTASADIIFVHGLGGTSRYSWAKHRNLELFWPQNWLPSELDVGTTRIFSFGYNAHYHSAGSGGALNVMDFAKSLLYDMRYGSSEGGTLFALGQRPIIFVAHSMGGLVFKQAYLQARHDPEISHIAGAIQAVMFLSTPHRGSTLAPLLNKILNISIKHSTKQYITDLAKNAPFLEQINEQFRQVAPELQIFSFYETLPTPVGPRSMMVVEKDSSTLGYPGERSRPLDADHHHVCKFDSVEDPNYKSVCWALRDLVRSLRDCKSTGDTALVRSDFQKVESLLGIDISSEKDFHFFLDRKAEGTCDWILKEPKLRTWILSPTRSAILWVYAKPASGKSVISAYLANHLKESGVLSQYFFFRFGDQARRTPSAMLMSLAWQIASDVPVFRSALASLGASGTELRRSDWRNIWKRVFHGLLFTLELSSPLYWVIDAIDESESSSATLEMLATVSQSKAPIRVLVTSRTDAQISSLFEKMKDQIPAESLSADDCSTDITVFASESLRYIWWNTEVKDEVVERLAQDANGNFLWVHLVLEAVKECHTEEAVKEALERLPVGMSPLYKRMEDNIAPNSDTATKNLAYEILTWTIHARVPIPISELIQIFGSRFGSFLNIRKTISQLCGHFVIIDGDDRLSLVHQTAKEYLVQSSTLPFSVDTSVGHRKLFESCLSVFMDARLRTRFQHSPQSVSLEYRATSWAYHLHRCSTATDLNQALTLLAKFFQKISILQWVHVVASLGKLQLLADASRRITLYLQKKRALDAANAPTLHRLEEIEILERWSRDLLKILGKFGTHILQDPSAIYNCVAPFCPQHSAIYRTFGKQSQRALNVTPLPEEWDDCLARLHIPGRQAQANVIKCSGRYIAVLTNDTVSCWDSTTFEELQQFRQGEYIHCISLSTHGDRIASYGKHSTHVWSLASARLICKIPNISDGRALALVFSKDDSELLTATDLREVMRVSLDGGSCIWQRLDYSLLREVSTIEGTRMNSPTTLAFNHETNLLAVAYRMFPLTVWTLDPPAVIARCKRTQSTDGSVKQTWTGVRDLVWHPNDEEILGVFTDGCVFKWNPYEDTLQELSAEVTGMASQIDVSYDGMMFGTSDRGGTIRLFDYSSFSLVYKLSSEEIVTGISFSPDGRRFYDLRGSYCNIWEPNILIRLTAMDEQISESQSEVGSLAQSHQASEAFAENPVPVKVMLPRPHSKIICVGNDEGSVELFDQETGSYQEIGRSIAELSVEHLAWSADGSRLAYVELGSRVMVSTVSVTGASAHVQSDSTSTMVQGLKLREKTPEALYLALLQSKSMSIKHFALTVVLIFSSASANDLQRADTVLSHTFSKPKI
ncbi:putative nacht and wd domain protein [Phaeomoniella chlamydospora]|uniref:Putative nacht and wd domain protein n=1 Tax=Phaeomoniella chlamydospora TaxID=158046 RepID=A0A0G2ES79_PHACM|nr:putative nacht and wd domain protein [Phaeomoniella chlamydospora]